MNKLSLKMKISVFIILILLILFTITKIDHHKGSSFSTPTITASTTVPTLTATTTVMKLGDHITVGTSLLTPTEIVQDNRCGTGLQCFQAGTVILAVNNSSDEGADVIDLPLNQTIVQDGLTLTLTDVTPYPAAKVPIDPANYRFTITIAQNLQ